MTYLSHLERLFSPHLVIIGGGISAVSNKYVQPLKLRARESGPPEWAMPPE